MMSETKQTFEQYQDELVAEAKEIQGDNYAGDDYYRQECWRDGYEDGMEPREAVLSDMSYWD